MTLCPVMGASVPRTTQRCEKMGAASERECGALRSQNRVARFARQPQKSQLVEQVKDKAIDTVAAPESRGFLFGCPVAKELGIGFVPIRKPGKLPRQTIQERCTLEYGVTTMEMHEDAISPGERVLLIDDVLATGGTALACASLIERQGGIVAGMGFLLDLQYIPRKAALVPYETFSLLTFTEQDVHGKREIVAA